MRLLISGATATLKRYLDSPFLGHLLVPGAGNSMRDILATGMPWAADNAAFCGFDPASFCSLLARIAGKPGCLFVACPDVVGDAAATLRLFEIWEPLLRQLDLPVALVGQDGLEDLPVPWDRIRALFLGGSTAWKLRRDAANLAREAKRRGCWVHLGRCNTLRRLRHAHAIGCDSVDGTAFSRWPDHHIQRALAWLAEMHGVTVQGQRLKKDPDRRFFPVARKVGQQLLDLPGWEVDKVRRQRDEYRVAAHYLPEPDACVRCGAHWMLAGGLRRHGVRRQALRDLPRKGRQVLIEVSRKRYRCLACETTFLQPLPDVLPGRRMTQRLGSYMLSQVATRSRASIAREVGIDEKTVRNLVVAGKDQLQSTAKSQLPDRSLTRSMATSS